MCQQITFLDYDDNCPPSSYSLCPSVRFGYMQHINLINVPSLLLLGSAKEFKRLLLLKLVWNFLLVMGTLGLSCIANMCVKVVARVRMMRPSKPLLAAL